MGGSAVGPGHDAARAGLPMRLHTTAEMQPATATEKDPPGQTPVRPVRAKLGRSGTPSGLPQVRAIDARHYLPRERSEPAATAVRALWAENG